MDDIEAEAGFLEDRDPEDNPSVLRITSDSDTGGCTYVKTRTENPGGMGLSPQIDSQT
jgi:hypothetical protein